MKNTVMIIVSDHNLRVQLRKMAEDDFGLTVLSVANARDGLALLQKSEPPLLLLLSSEKLTLMNPLDFLLQKSQDPRLAKIPVILLASSPGASLPPEVAEEVALPLTKEALANLLEKYGASAEVSP